MYLGRCAGCCYRVNNNINNRFAAQMHCQYMTVDEPLSRRRHIGLRQQIRPGVTGVPPVTPDEVLSGFASTNERKNGKDTIYDFVCSDEDVTYCLNGKSKEGVFRKKGQPFRVQAKVEGEDKASITKWFTIIPSDKSSQK